MGGGPAGLFFGILIKKALPNAEVTVHERNKHDDTFGWGVVFSDETLDNLEGADPESFNEIRNNFIYWQGINTFYRGTCTHSTGHGFCGLSRKKLLLILQDRCRALGVDLHFGSEIADFEALRDADLVIGCDGYNSLVRDRYKETFRPHIDMRKCKFAWFGSDRVLDAFTFIFKETEHGLFQVHAYPFEEGRATWIVECREDAWKRAGLDVMDEEESARWCEALFAEELDGAHLLTNRSLWRSFPTVKCKTWHHENVVLMGDSAHTAHFSIGSGTKLAMEDAIALTEAFKELGTADVPRVLQAYEEARFVDVLKTQKAAQTSLEWFENSARYLGQDPVRFKFNLMSRSKQITYDNLGIRDPALVELVTERFAEEEGTAPLAAPIFAPFRLRDLELANRMVVSPMCQYSAVDGTVTDWHLVHLGSRAIGGAALVLTEMTNVTTNGRITPACAGMYDTAHVAAWKRITDFVHTETPAKIGLQLAHAGRKGSCSHPWDGWDVPLPASEAWPTMAPSPLAFADGHQVPKEMDRADMNDVRDAFVRATEMAEDCGFDLVELHMAHGYLLSNFISPLTNRRRDVYGGEIEARMRYPLEVFDAVRRTWPAAKPLSVRISATDWLDDDGGLTADDSVIVARLLHEHGLDLIDVSSSGNVTASEPIYGRMFQVPFAEQIRYEVGIPVMAVGAILGTDHANTILAAGRADLCALARPHLRNPYLTLHAAADYGHDDQWWPGQYLLGKPPSKTEDSK
ncbi:MAG: oxidoreductase [Planctomycetes bacterium]|nr:oxidoreductase [Planctomycetota bacterium]